MKIIIRPITANARIKTTMMIDFLLMFLAA